MFVGNMFWCVLIAQRAEFFSVCVFVTAAAAAAIVVIVLFRVNSYAIDKIFRILIVG